jgi:hypothetical protein
VSRVTLAFAASALAVGSALADSSALAQPAGTEPGGPSRPIKVLDAADMKELPAQQGLVAEASPPELLTAQVRGDIAKWREVVARAGITAE